MSFHSERGLRPRNPVLGEVLEGAVEAPANVLALAWCRWGRNAERRMAGAARLTTEVLHERVRRRLVVRLRGVAKLGGLHLVVLRRGLELGPLFPDLFLRGGLAHERARREQRRDLLGVLGHRVGLGGDAGQITGLRLGLRTLPRLAVGLHELL